MSGVWFECCGAAVWVSCSWVCWACWQGSASASCPRGMSPRGLFLSPGLSLSSYKQCAMALGNDRRLQNFLQVNDLAGSQTAELLSGMLKAPGALENAVSPMFGRRDVWRYSRRLSHLRVGLVAGQSGQRAGRRCLTRHRRSWRPVIGCHTTPAFANYPGLSSDAKQPINSDHRRHRFIW